MSAPHAQPPDTTRTGRAAELYQVWAQEAAEGLASLAPALQSLPTRVSPQMARAAQATENAWRDIDAEFGLLTSTQVAQRMGYEANRTWASTRRKDGQLLGVLRGGRYVYPGFQFDGSQVSPVMAGLLELAAEHGWSEESLTLWLCSPSTYINAERRPVDVLHTEPADVLSAARTAMNPPW